MGLAEGIRKIGFRHWYERQLIESHLYLISGFMCLVTVLACLEGFSLRTPVWETVMRFTAMMAGAAICLWTVHRYFAMLAVAEYVAERSVCEKCATYRGLELSGVAVRRADARNDDDEALPPVGVRCRKCGHEWTIE
jgi:ribosomal protein L40E